MTISMESTTSIPILPLDDEPNENLLSTTKSLGYCYISRSSLTFGDIADCSTLKLLVDELFQLLLEKKTIFDPDFTRSIDFDKFPMKKEMISDEKIQSFLKNDENSIC